MRLLWFSPSVYVKAKRVEGAAQELVAWDTKARNGRRRSKSCVDAFEGRVSPQEVREAFEAAAKEATVYLSPE
ncbi:MAG: DUF982 domain-containing protein [Mesorhizobium sp.]|uniref:DUF982 domain-containing protein n=1 Tax=Mesorhizobium sp. TaxID=1871066 RepID=UPI000FE90C4A|nr:MAG: DUF982 domain-containing protein [Mesorhizobium sp.]